MYEPPVTIDIGGVLHYSTKSSLEKSSVIKKILLEHQKSEHSHTTPFIDRDGFLFYYILNFLRNGTIQKVEDPSLMQAIMLEAVFYNIRALETQINEFLT